MIIGQYLVHSMYQMEEGSACLLVWNCMDGREFKRLKGLVSLPLVCTLTDDARLVAFVLSNTRLYLWTLHHRSHLRGRAGGTADTSSRSRQGGVMRAAEGARGGWTTGLGGGGQFVQLFPIYEGFRTGLSSERCKVSLKFIMNGEFLLVGSREGVTVWSTTTLELVNAFSPDFQMFDTVPIMDGRVIVYGNKDQTQVSSLLLRSPSLDDPRVLNDLCGPKVNRFFPSKGLQDMLSGKDKDSEENLKEQNLLDKLEKFKEKIS